MRILLGFLSLFPLALFTAPAFSAPGSANGATAHDLLIEGRKSAGAFNFSVTSNPSYNTSEDGVTLYIRNNQTFGNVRLTSVAKDSGLAGLAALDKLTVVTVEGDVLLKTGPSAAKAATPNRAWFQAPVLRFTADKQHSLVLHNSSPNSKDSVWFAADRLIVEKGATLAMTLFTRGAENCEVTIAQLRLEPAARLSLDKWSGHSLPFYSLCPMAGGTAAPATLALDGRDFAVQQEQGLIFILDESHLAQQGAPCLRVEGRGGKLVLNKESVTLSLPPSLAARIEAGKNLPLVAGDFTAEFYRTPRACNVDGKSFEIYLDDASGTPALYARRL